MVLRKSPGDHREAAQRFADVAGFIRRQRHATALIAEGANSAAFGRELGVDLELADEFAGRAAEARESRGGVRTALEEFLHGREGLRDATELELVQRYRGRKGIRSVADRGLESELSSAAEIAVGELAAELR